MDGGRECDERKSAGTSSAMFAPARCSLAASSPGMSAIEPPYTHDMPVNNSANAVPYLARIIQEHLVADPDGRAWSRDGTASAW